MTKFNPEYEQQNWPSGAKRVFLDSVQMSGNVNCIFDHDINVIDWPDCFVSTRNMCHSDNTFWESTTYFRFCLRHINQISSTHCMNSSRWLNWGELWSSSKDRNAIALDHFGKNWYPKNKFFSASKCLLLNIQITQRDWLWFLSALIRIFVIDFLLLIGCWFWKTYKISVDHNPGIGCVRSLGLACTNAFDASLVSFIRWNDERQKLLLSISFG